MIDWDESKADDAAKKCGILLSVRHWQIIYTFRELYFIKNHHPATRVLIKALHEANYAATMLELMQLFGERPLRTISQIAGLPEPPHCV